MTVKLAQGSCSIRVPRVQCGVPPNCEETRRQTRIRSHYAIRRPSVSGGTPETTRETRVLHPAIEGCRWK